ncbi:MAG: hypothetical protein GFH25_541324n30 [Chloroflexi bacterium AL-N10]|nr:hypothetical protein [Chloroflexi bacterium AL-N10]
MQFPFQATPRVTDDVTGVQRIRSYDIRVAAQHYANIAGLLGGFAFTIIILVTQENDAFFSGAEVTRRNLAAVGFFIAFFGCLLASFVFGLIASEEALTSRATHMAFFAGIGFSLSISLLFWSLATILRAFLVEDIARIAYQIFPLFVIAHPIYVLASILDDIYIFNCRKPMLREYVHLLQFSIPPLLGAIVLRWLGLVIDIEYTLAVFHILMGCFVGLILLNMMAAALCSTTGDYFRLPLSAISIWMGINTTLIGILLILV